MNTNRRNRSPRTGTILVVAVVATIGPSIITDSAAQADLRTVALTDNVAPGASFQFSEFGAPILNGVGDVAFNGDIDDGNFTGGLWVEDNLVLNAVAFGGDVAPGTGGAMFDSFDSISSFFLNDVAQIGIGHTVDDGAKAGAFSQTGVGDTFEKVAVGDDPAPGTNDPARVYQPFFGIVGGFNTFGETTFQASMPPTGTGNPGNFPSSGVWMGSPGLLTKVAEVGDAAPGTATLFNDFHTPVINENHQVAFAALIGGGGSSAGVWQYDDNTTALSLVATSGQSAPGTATTFSIFFGSTVAQNNDGDVGFTATLTGLIGGGLRDGVWADRSGSIEKVAFESETAPGTGSTFDQIRTDAFAIGVNGDVTFESSLADGRSGLFSDSGGSLHAIALTDAVAPDSGGASISNIVRWTANDLGQVAFMAELDEPGFPDVIFATDLSGELHRIVGQDDMIEVAPGDLRQIEFLNFMGLDGSIGMSGTNVTNGFDHDGQIAFSATFLSDEFHLDPAAGVFVTAVPEMALAGDYNHDGIVDAADYVVWRKTGGSQTGYDTWRANFGATAAVGATIAYTRSSNVSIAVPEPALLSLLTWFAAMFALHRRNRTLSK